MRSELLVGELAGIIRRLENRIKTTPKYASLLQQDTEDAALELTLDGIEDAIAGLVLLHIHLRESKR